MEPQTTKPNMVLITTLQSFLVRGLFAVHATLCVWRVVEATSLEIFWSLLFINILLLIFEGLVTYRATEKKEWTVFSPCVLIYLLTVIPCIWAFEFHLYFKRQELAEENDVDCEEITETHNISCIDHEIMGINFDWSLGLKQMFLFVLIIGRWLLPKGEMKPDQLSQLLFVYIGMAADILEFIIDGMSMSPVSCSAMLMTMILCIGSLSVIQFTISLTFTKPQNDLNAGLNADTSDSPRRVCCETEVWAIMVTVLMQDGPFLGMRLYLIAQFYTMSQMMMLFFAAKNALILVLQFYRLKSVVAPAKPRRHAPLQTCQAGPIGRREKNFTLTLTPLIQL